MDSKFVGIVRVPGTHIREIPLSPEITPPPSNQDDSPESSNVIYVDFRKKSEIPRPTPDVQSVSDLGRLMMVKWQSRTASGGPEAAPKKNSRWLGRAATVLGSSALITTLWTLGSRGAQAYAMARHGTDLGMDSAHASSGLGSSLHETLQPHQSASSSHHEVMMLASSKRSDGVPDNGVHHYGGVRVEGADYADNSRTAESWRTDKDCAWNWAKQDLATEAHKAGLTDNQIRTVAHDESAIARVTKTYINSNGSIKNAPHHWLYTGHTYNTEASRAVAADIVHDSYPGSHAEHSHPSPSKVELDSDHDGVPDNKDSTPHTPNNPANTEPKDKDPDLGQPSASKPNNTEQVSWVEAQWNDFVGMWKHVYNMEWKDVGNELKNGWNKFWGGDWLKVAVLGTALFAMRKYELGRRAYHADYGSPWRHGFREVTWRRPRTWRKVDWGAWRRRPVATEEPTQTSPDTARVGYITDPSDPPTRV